MAEVSNEFEKVSSWLRTAFPDHSCGKCGNKNFYSFEPPSQQLPDGELTYTPLPVMKLVCDRCGMVEEHFTGILKHTLEKTKFKPLLSKGRVK